MYLTTNQTTAFDKKSLPEFHFSEKCSAFQQQTVSSYSGWLSISDIETRSSKSVVEYMALLNVTSNANSTVQHIHETSPTANPEVRQQYAFVTFVAFDLAMAKKTNCLVRQLLHLKMSL